MADLPGDIGYLTVTGRLRLAIADSTDGGAQPDAVVGTALMTFTPVDDPLAAVNDDEVILAQPITCKLDAGGFLVPPADGVSADPAPGAANAVNLVAPNQLSLNRTNWMWELRAEPLPPQTWKPFVRYFTGAPGDVITLAQIVASSAAASPGVVAALIYPVATTDEPFPDGYRVGIDLLLTPDGNLWSTES